MAILGNFVNRALVLIGKYYDGKVPARGELTETDENALAQIGELRAKIEKNIEHYHFREALFELMNLARLGNKYLADAEPWKTIKTDEVRTATVLNIAAHIVASLSIAMQPFLPFSAEKLRTMINLPKNDWEILGDREILAEGHQLGKAELLFEKIDDEAIDAQIAKLNAIKEAKAAEAITAEPQKEMISYDDFAKLDLRVGTVLEAERVPKTDKLMKLLVDTGIDKRTIVSGIAQHFSAEDLVGKQVTVLVNLSPRKMKGIESVGMLLFASDPKTGKLLNVAPEAEAMLGSTIA